MGPEQMLNVAAFAVQGCVIAGTAAILLEALRIGSASTRYLCWRLVLAACLVMPVLLQRAPARVPLDIAAAGPDAGPALLMDPAALATPMELPATPLTGLPWANIAAFAIALGAALRGAWLLAGLIRLRRLRRRGYAVDATEYAEIQSMLGTHATLRSVEGLAQPATFGVWRPVILLPSTLADSPPALRRAVVTHELFHVQRRDWLWVLGEELLRTALWFHPAIVWLTTRIQLAREEVVDELTVLATGNRRAYIEALLSFADAGRVRPAPAFAGRRQLFTRIVRLSKEGVMSSPRIVVSAGFLVAAVLGTSWYAGHAFPIISAATELPAIGTQAPEPQARRPVRRSDAPAARGEFRTTPERRPVVPAQGPRSGGAPRPGPVPVAAPPAAAKPITPENPIPRRLSAATAAYPTLLRGSGYRGVVVLQVVLDASGSIADVRRLRSEVGGGDADPTARSRAAEAFFTAATDAVRRWRYQSPADPPIAFSVTVRFEGEGDAIALQSLEPAGGVRVGGPALAAAPDAPRAQVVLAEVRLDYLRAQRAQAAAQYGEQDSRTLEITKQQQAMERELERARTVYEASLPAQDAGAATGARASGPGAFSGQPVRVGGNIRPPAKTRHVNPDYPEIAKFARVQGVVIMEIVIDEQGRVAQARILRSIPLLDQAALDAVRQWEFEPTHLNGVAVPIIMTVTVQFSLPQDPQ